MWGVDPGSRACRSRLVWWRRPLIIWTRMLNGRLPGEAQSRGPGCCLCVWGLWSGQIPPALAAFPGGLALPRASNYRSKRWVVALVRAGGTLPVVQPQALAALGLISQLDLDWAWLRMQTVPMNLPRVRTDIDGARLMMALVLGSWNPFSLRSTRPFPSPSSSTALPLISSFSLYGFSFLQLADVCHI